MGHGEEKRDKIPNEIEAVQLKDSRIDKTSIMLENQSAEGTPGDGTTDETDVYMDMMSNCAYVNYKTGREERGRHT